MIEIEKGEEESESESESEGSQRVRQHGPRNQMNEEADQKNKQDQIISKPTNKTNKQIKKQSPSVHSKGLQIANNFFTLLTDYKMMIMIVTWRNEIIRLHGCICPKTAVDIQNIVNMRS